MLSSLFQNHDLKRHTLHIKIDSHDDSQIPNRTHHCEKCQGPFKHTCIDDEHMYQCPSHQEVYSKKQGGCATCEMEEFMRRKREREAAEKDQKKQKKMAEDAWFRDPKPDDSRKKSKKDNKKLKNKAHTVGRLFGKRWYVPSPENVASIAKWVQKSCPFG